MRSRITAVVAATGFLLSAAPARADEPKPDAFYLGLAFGKAHQAQRAPGDTNDALVGWAAGYSFNKSLAVEVYGQAYLFGSLGGWFRGVGGRPEQTDLADEHLGVAAVGAVALADSWRLRGRVGVGRTKVGVFAAGSGDFLGTAKRTDPTVGVGLAFDPSARWTLSLDVGRLTKTKVDTVALGAEFRF